MIVVQALALSFIPVFAATAGAAMAMKAKPSLQIVSAVQHFAVVLALCVFAQSGWVLRTGNRPTPSPLGIVWLVVTCAVMMLLAWGKLATGRRLGNSVLTTEARVTVIDTLLAASVLIGVGLNALFGWWWADPLAGFVIVYYGLTEGRAAWRHGGT